MKRLLSLMFVFLLVALTSCSNNDVANNDALEEGVPQEEQEYSLVDENGVINNDYVTPKSLTDCSKDVPIIGFLVKSPEGIYSPIYGAIVWDDMKVKSYGYIERYDDGTVHFRDISELETLGDYASLNAKEIVERLKQNYVQLQESNITEWEELLESERTTFNREPEGTADAIEEAKQHGIEKDTEEYPFLLAVTPDNTGNSSANEIIWFPARTGALIDGALVNAEAEFNPPEVGPVSINLLDIASPIEAYDTYYGGYNIGQVGIKHKGLYLLFKCGSATSFGIDDLTTEGVYNTNNITPEFEEKQKEIQSYFTEIKEDEEDFDEEY